MTQKIRIALLFGGRSVEHEISLRSAKNVYEALDKDKYEACLIGIDKEGHWHVIAEEKLLDFTQTPLLPESNALRVSKEGKSLTLPSHIDVVFPILHGPLGEDGTVQGLLKLLNVPFVGASVTGSALGMDKDVMKRLLRDAGIPIADFVTLKKNTRMSFEEMVDRIGLPFFIKPSNSGSSVGVSKVKSKEEFEKAIEVAFAFDTKVIGEEYIPGREIEIAILGYDNPKASLPGEVITQHEFYSYEAKYLDENGAILKYPAEIEPAIIKKMQQTAIHVFEVLCSEIMARVDFFLRHDGTFVVNEINTIPGFTNISMFPKLWEVSGIPYSKLIDELISLSLARYEIESQLKTHVTY